MNLETERLLISEITSEDIKDIHHINSYEVIAQFNTIGVPKVLSDTQKLLQPILDDQLKKERTWYLWVIRKKGTSEVIGQIGMIISAKKYNKAEIYYSLLPSQWRKGYATEAVKEIIRFGFNTLQLHRIEAGVATENTASIKILEKIGMTREGLHRKILPLKSGWADNYGYAILEEDKRMY